MEIKRKQCNVCGSNRLLLMGNILECKKCKNAWCNEIEDYDPNEAYPDYHICRCQAFDRKNCPTCHQKCHHDTPLAPRLTTDHPNGGGSAMAEKIPERQLEYEVEKRRVEELPIL